MLEWYSWEEIMWWGERDTSHEHQFHGADLVAVKHFLIGLPCYDWVAAVIAGKK